MFKLLLGIIIFIVVIVISILVLGIGLLRRVLGIGRKSSPQNRDSREPDQPYSGNTNDVFGRDEGEYVDFEEIEDDSTK